MKNKLIGVTTILGLSLGSLFITESAHAVVKTQSEISSERSSIKKNISKTEAGILDVLIDLQEIEKEITNLDNTLKANQDAKTGIVKEIKATEENIGEIELEIDVFEENIEARFKILKQRASSYQKSGGHIGYLDVVIGAKDCGELISRISAVNKIKSSDAELINQQEMDKELVEKQRNTVEDKLTGLKGEKEELEMVETLVTEQMSEIDMKEKELKNKENELNKVKSELQIQDDSLATLEAKVKATFNSSGSNSNNIKESNGINETDTASSNSGSGQLSWPTSGGYISSHLGQRGGKMHKGIDIARTDRSTSPPIIAADSGVVESTGFSGGYGNKVVINHENGMKTIYAHLSSISVSPGQTVTKGTTLGIMGTTGNSTGIHLHFEVYVNNTLQNPINYFN